ncbi:hypothetical protein [Winogradskyella haliclonae]|uniref:Outer membrane protein beta-barrel domain-containing protein n=1 Tax=Winogradskyella haliclonae TaxID=2048558 RepID=A0ABQ2BTQ8_9FLAO|nr:hypothetical protein [Winogradskyella haliclonae]GGI55864.1 hypothetical protein GCM10011444_01730 [Winogradskyella haliclonae]
MKKIILSCLFLVFIAIGYAQKTYKVGEETLELRTEVDGELDLLWTVTNGTYRYFIKTKDGTITELKNTRGEGRAFNKEYISALNNLTSGSTLSAENVKLTTGSLKRFIDKYNKSVDIDYNVRNTNSKVNFRLAFFGGLTNHPLVEDIDDQSSLQLAAELELFGDTDNPIHSGMLQARQTFGSSGDYKSTEFSLGYRVRFLRKEGFNIYAQTRFATLNSFSVDRPIFTDDVATPIGVETQRESEFDVPFIFGIGVDIKISDNSYISILYDRFYAFGLDNNDSFPTDFMIGYKFNL